MGSVINNFFKKIIQICKTYTTFRHISITIKILLIYHKIIANYSVIVLMSYLKIGEPYIKLQFKI